MNDLPLVYREYPQRLDHFLHHQQFFRMRVLIQRVSHAKVTVEDQVTGSIQQGLLLLVGFGQGDSEVKLKPMVEKISNLRVFSDEQSKFNLSVMQIKGGVLLVPQFTLYADTSRGRRPDFFSSLPPKEAEELFDKFVSLFRQTEISPVAQGVFGVHMHVDLQNDGPVTIMLEL